MESDAGCDTMMAPVPVSCAHVRFAGPVVSPLLPPCVPSPVPHQGNALTVFVARSTSPDDTAISLWGGWDTNATGSGDSRHVFSGPSTPSQGLKTSPPLVALSFTASSVNLEMMDALDEIAAGRSYPLSDNSSVDDDIPVPFLQGRRKVEYDNLWEVAGDIQALADRYEAVRGMLARILGVTLVLEERVERQGRWITTLESQVDEMRCGEYEFPALPLKRKEQTSRVPVAQAPKRAPNKPAVAKNKTPPIPTQTRPVAVAGPAACASGSWVDMVRRKAPRAQKPAPLNTKPVTRTPSSASPSPITTRECHITLRFVTRKAVVLPAGVSVETMRSRMNSYFANQPKVGGSSPYVKEARLRADVGWIYATLTAHSYGQVAGMLAGCHAVGMRDLGLPDFTFR